MCHLVSCCRGPRACTCLQVAKKLVDKNSRTLWHLSLGKLSEPLNRHPSTSCGNASLQTLIATRGLCSSKNKTATAQPTKMSCCPPSALPYLAAKPATKGSKKAIDGVEFYETGAQSKAAIILFPDVWGWDSGRTRALADAFAEQGYRTYVPKVLQPAFQGGTDGDGLPPDFDLGSRMEEFMGWVKTVKWDGIDKKVNALLAYAKAEGATSIGVVGCCWSVVPRLD